MLIEEFTHRVLNEYSRAIAGLRLAAHYVDDAKARRGLIEAADHLHAQAHAHRALAMPAGEARCDVAEYIARVCSATANALSSETKLRLHLEACETMLSADRCWLLALIVSELIHNAARHGSQGGEIVVELAAAETQLLCQVSNTSTSSAAPRCGRGRRVVAALARELNGRADWLFAPMAVRAWVVVPLDGAAVTGAQ